ncbi:MAG: hypothetical protein QUS07_10105 [Methanothrix sp.]|nr:hypothetical protein [Methanothrix sp.]
MAKEKDGDQALLFGELSYKTRSSLVLFPVECPGILDRWKGTSFLA